MREIKFRFWDKEENDWLVDGQDETSIYDFAFRYGMNWDHIGEPLNRVVVMQYIGLKDKNGKEIYEGDIISVDNGDYSGFVKFNEADLSYVIENRDGGFSFVNGQIYDERPEYRTYEIIGNIYEDKI